MGPNTGGMGAITHPFCSYKKNDVYSLNTEIEKILIKSIVAINNSSGDTSNYNGFLYLGLMISADDNKPLRFLNITVDWVTLRLKI